MQGRWRDWLLLAGVSIVSTVALWATVGMKTIYENFDGPYYAVVAKTWYQKELIGQQFAFSLPYEYYAAHLPVYPFLMAVVALSGMHLLAAGSVATLASAIVGAVVVYELARRMKLDQPLWIAGTWLFAWPRMWAVRSVASPEPLFALLICLALYTFGKRKYVWAGILGGLATLTKTPGALLLPSFGLYWLYEWYQTKRFDWRAWPVLLIGGAFLLLCGFYGVRTGDVLAYFHSGDNIHLQIPPFRIFNSDQPWVGTFWLEDVLWVYFIGAIGVYRAFKKQPVWGIFGGVFLTALLFVSHRDISRYALPLVPVLLIGFAEVFKRKDMKLLLVAMLVPLFFYTANFVTHNRVMIADWTPFFLFSK